MAGEDITDDMRRVLSAICSKSSSQAPGAMIALRRTACEALDGDTEKAAKVLADLDARGFIRTNVMGWHTGWITALGREVSIHDRASS